MRPRTRREASGSRWVVLLAVALAVAPALAGPTNTRIAESRVPRPALDVPRGDKCVADPNVMRRDHMKLLLHQREETVHRGTRPRDTSLEACIACHASQKTSSVVGSDQNFCQGCHAYAAVKLDCFECHSSKPQATAAAAEGRILGGTQ